MTLRAIFLRHGKKFSPNQWLVILDQVLLPSIQAAIKNDCSAIVHVVSDSPTKSILDFMSSNLPLPPPIEDDGLQRFAHKAHEEERYVTFSLYRLWTTMK